MSFKTGSKESILSKFAEKMGNVASPVRRDIGIILYTNLEADSARVLASYRGDVPSFEEVRAWAIDTLGGQIKVFADTLAVYDTTPYPVLSFIAETNKIRKPYKEAVASGGYMAVSKNTYLDTDLGTTWIKEEVDGRSFLVRVQPDGIGPALEKVVAHAGPRMRQVAHEILSATAGMGDVVRYFRPDTTVGIGTVISSGGKLLSIKDRDSGNVYDRSPGSILEIISEGTDTKKRKKDMEDYFAGYLGSDLAKKMMS